MGQKSTKQTKKEVTFDEYRTYFYNDYLSYLTHMTTITTINKIDTLYDMFLFLRHDGYRYKSINNLTPSERCSLSRECDNDRRTGQYFFEQPSPFNFKTDINITIDLNFLVQLRTKITNKLTEENEFISCILKICKEHESTNVDNTMYKIRNVLSEIDRKLGNNIDTHIDEISNLINKRISLLESMQELGGFSNHNRIATNCKIFLDATKHLVNCENSCDKSKERISPPIESTPVVVTVCKQSEASTSVQATVCKQDEASTSVQAIVCKQDEASTSVQAITYDTLPIAPSTPIIYATEVTKSSDMSFAQAVLL